MRVRIKDFLWTFVDNTLMIMFGFLVLGISETLRLNQSIFNLKSLLLFLFLSSIGGFTFALIREPLYWHLKNLAVKSIYHGTRKWGKACGWVSGIGFILFLYILCSYEGWIYVFLCAKYTQIEIWSHLGPVGNWSYIHNFRALKIGLAFSSLFFIINYLIARDFFDLRLFKGNSEDFRMFGDFLYVREIVQILVDKFYA